MAKSSVVVDPDVKPAVKTKTVRKTTSSIAKTKTTKAKDKGKGKATDVIDEVETLNDAFEVCLRLDDTPAIPAVGENENEKEKEKEKDSYRNYNRAMYRVQKPLTSTDILSRSVPVSGSVSQGYFSLLKDFRAGYPESTDIHCWWCCHPFTGRPVGFPKKMHGMGDCFQTIGCFCSFHCASAYGKRDPELQHSLALLSGLCRASTFAPSDDNTKMPAGVLTLIRPAPPREALKMFGGEMSIADFREAGVCGKPWRLISAPMMPWPMYAEEIMAKQGTTSFTRNGMQRTIEIRKSTEHPGIANPGSSRLPNFPLNPRKPLAPASSNRTTIGQLISFA